MADSSAPVTWVDGQTHDRIHLATGTRWTEETVRGRLQWTHAEGALLAVTARALIGTWWVWQLWRGKEMLASGREVSEAGAMEAALASARHHA